MKLCTCLIFMLPVLSASAQGQSSQPPAASRAGLISAYQTLAGHESRLYNGIRRTPYDPKMIGSAFFPADSPMIASVYYDGMYFDNVAMQFDLYRQELVVLHFSQFRFSLLPEKTISFSVAGHHFVHHGINQADRKLVPPGFYDHLYDGHSAILAHRFVFITKKVTNDIILTFVPKTEFYVRRHGVFVSCNNRRAAFRLFGQSGKQVRRHLQSKKIRFKKNFETALVESFRFLDGQP
jgi:hypothetical protein